MLLKKVKLEPLGNKNNVVSQEMYKKAKDNTDKLMLDVKNIYKHFY